MNYVTVSELKHSKTLWERLSAEKELILTRDGKPGALLLEVNPENVEQTLSAIRRSLFSETVTNVRRKGLEKPISPETIEREIQAVRKQRQ